MYEEDKFVAIPGAANGPRINFRDSVLSIARNYEQMERNVLAYLDSDEAPAYARNIIYTVFNGTVVREAAGAAIHVAQVWAEFPEHCDVYPDSEPLGNGMWALEILMTDLRVDRSLTGSAPGAHALDGGS